MSCLPGRAHSLLVRECYLLRKPGNCLLGRVHSLPVRECHLPRKHGNWPVWESGLSAGERVLSSKEAWELPAWGVPAWELPTWESALSAGESMFFLGGLGTACLRTDCLGEHTLSQRESAINWGSLDAGYLGEHTLCQ